MLRWDRLEAGVLKIYGQTAGGTVTVMANRKGKGKKGTGNQNRVVYSEFGGSVDDALERAVVELPPANRSCGSRPPEKGGVEKR